MEEKQTKPKQENRNKTDNIGGRPKGPAPRLTSLADLVTFEDLKYSVKAMKAIIRDPEAPHGQKIIASKFLFQCKLEGIKINIQKAGRKAKAEQQQNGTEKPKHEITSVYKTTENLDNKEKIRQNTLPDSENEQISNNAENNTALN